LTIIPLFQHSTIPSKGNNAIVIKSYMLSVCYRNYETFILFTPSQARWQINSKDRNEYGHRNLATGC